MCPFYEDVTAITYSHGVYHPTAALFAHCSGVPVTANTFPKLAGRASHVTIHQDGCTN